MRRGRPKDAIEILRARVPHDDEMEQLLDEARAMGDIAQLVYDARTEANLTQKELAAKVGTSQPAIARLEDADYQGHSLRMLQRIAKALGKRAQDVVIRNQGATERTVEGIVRMVGAA